MTIELTVDRFEGNIAILKTNDGSTINWQKKLLPNNAKEGSVLNFSITDDKQITKEKSELAKDILNEILNPEEN